MTITNRLTVGTHINGVFVAAVYDPFMEQIQLEIGGRALESMPGSANAPYFLAMRNCASDMHYLLIGRYDFAVDFAYAKYKAAIEAIATYCRT